VTPSLVHRSTALHDVLEDSTHATIDMHSRELRQRASPTSASTRSQLVLAIATINTWNRINAATRQITGEWVEQVISTEPAGQAA
jgi:hypothetical protein